MRANQMAPRGNCFSWGAFACCMDAVALDHPSIPLPVASEAALPFALRDWLSKGDAAVAVFVSRDEAALRLLARTMPIMVPERRVLPLPGWDNLPYDRSRPSHQATGQRIAALAGLADASATPRLLLTTPESLLQRVPAPGRVRERAIPLVMGQSLDADWLRDTLL